MNHPATAAPATADPATAAPAAGPAPPPLPETLVPDGGALSLPARLGRALEANDRAKYYLTLLQAARDRAAEPARGWSSLREERLAARVPDPDLDRTVGSSERRGTDSYIIPGAAAIWSRLATAVHELVEPLDDAVADARLERIVAEAPELAGDLVPGRWLDALTADDPAGGASLHRLIMDAHRAVNRLLAATATHTVAGASVHDLSRDDEELVTAFATGVTETSPLRFDHPGLATSATRTGGRLLIQNDLGTTRAHLVVVAVEGPTATVTYSDVHRRRADFFVSMLDDWPVAWSSPPVPSGPGGDRYHLRVGRMETGDRCMLGRFLHHLGTRLVFLLDWNRARKRLGSILATDDAVAVLRWAAANDLGHMAFLALGAERLIYDAVELSGRVPARYGEPLTDVLGRDTTLALTRFAIRAATEGLTGGKSQLLIRDEVRVEVIRTVLAHHRRMLDSAAEHAALVVECARALQRALMHTGRDGDQPVLARAAAQAAAFEHRADRILVDQREGGARADTGPEVTSMTATADDGIDGLEEAAFLLTLLPPDAVGPLRPLLDPLASLGVRTAREYLKAVEVARLVVDGSAAEDLEDFLVAVDRVTSLEHEADRADRRCRGTLVTTAPDFRTLYVADHIARSIEGATDALMRAALDLRDRLLAELANR